MNIYYLTPKLDGLLQKQKNLDCLKEGLFCQKNTNMNINKDITGVDLIYESFYQIQSKLKKENLLKNAQNEEVFIKVNFEDNSNSFSRNIIINKRV